MEQAGEMKHKITVERNLLRFSAAHFTTFGGECEPLHGHNYDVRAEIEGALTADAWVLDFVELKRIMARLCQELDHRFLLPLDNPHLTIKESDSHYEISFTNRCYVMPKVDVCPLSIDNSTAERLAQWLCQRLVSELRDRGSANVGSVTIAVEEAPGQAGWCTLSVSTS